MCQRIWENRLEFYPYVAILFFWFFGSFLQSLTIGSRPGIITLGLVTILPVGLITIAMVKTYRTLPPTGQLPGPRERISIGTNKTRSERLTSPSTDAYASADPLFDRRFALITYSLLVIITLYTTYLHHFQPQILRVPSNTDISSWHYPPFKDTYLYDHMSESERMKFIAEGVPNGTNMVYQFGTDIFTLFLAFLVLLHSLKYCGFWMSTCFLVGSFVFTGLEESMFILMGRFLPVGMVNAFGEPVAGTYWFTKGGLWFFECPFQACIGWYVIAYSCVLTAGKVFPKRGLLWRAFVGGMIAMTLDLWMDPVVTSPEIVAWVWPKGGHLIVFGIPDTNFVGWFNLIFLFAIFWELLPKLLVKWGRLRASVVFFLILIATEVAIAIGMILYSTIVGQALLGLGYNAPLRIPHGW